jgi:hypothetical protein
MPTLGGVLVIRGTRIPVYDVAASVAAGLPIRRILAAYPSLDADKIDLTAITPKRTPREVAPDRATSAPRRCRRSAGSSAQERGMKFLIDVCPESGN